MNRLLMSAAAAALVAFAAEAQARDQIRVVGSSTVFPFSTAVAEQFGQKSGLKTPVVESTGTGGGFKLFCGGVGEDTPDITNASRRDQEGRARGLRQGRRDRGHRGQDRLRRHRAGQQQAAPAVRALREGDLAGAGQGGAGRRQAGRQPQHDLEPDQPRPAGREDRGAGPAADLRHARRLRRAGHGPRLRGDPRGQGADRRQRQEGRCARPSARTASTSTPARTTT